MSETFSCPACQSVIATDGRALRQRSPFLEDLIETANDVPKLEQRLNELERATVKSAPVVKFAPPKKKAAKKKAVKKKVSNKKTEVKADEVQLDKGSESGAGESGGGSAEGGPGGGDYFDEL